MSKQRKTRTAGGGGWDCRTRRRLGCEGLSSRMRKLRRSSTVAAAAAAAAACKVGGRGSEGGRHTSVFFGVEIKHCVGGGGGGEPVPVQRLPQAYSSQHHEWERALQHHSSAQALDGRNPRTRRKHETARLR